MNTKDANAKDSLTDQANEIKIRLKKRSFSRSKIRPYFVEIKHLRDDHGFSFNEISLWLRTFKNVKISPDGVRTAYQRVEKKINLITK